jgi:Ca2+-binding RTX toxin-like protein
MAGTEFGIEVELGLSGGVYSLHYPAQIAIAIPDQVRAGDNFQVLSGLAGVGAASMTVTGPSVSLSERILFRTDLSGHLGFEWSGILGVDDGALALIGSTSDGGITYTDTGVPWELGYDIFDLSTEGQRVLNQNLQWTEETLGGRKVFRNPFIAVEYQIGLEPLNGIAQRTVGADGLVDLSGVIMPDEAWGTLSFDIDDISGALLSLVNPAVGKLVSELDTEYRVKHSVFGIDLGSSIDGGLLSLTGSLGVRPALKFEFDAQDVLVSLVASTGEVRSGRLGDSFSFASPSNGAPLSITASYQLAGTVKSSAGLVVTGRIEARAIGIEGEVFGIDIPAFFADGSDEGTEADSYLFQFIEEWNLASWFPSLLSSVTPVSFGFGQTSTYNLTYGSTTVVPSLDLPNRPTSLSVTVTGTPANDLGVHPLLEGNEGATTPIALVIARSGDLTQATTANFSFVLGEGVTADDLTNGLPMPGTVSFAPGETTKTIALNWRGDALAELDEEIDFLLSSSAIVDNPLTSLLVVSDDQLLVKGSGLISGSSRNELIQGSPGDDRIFGGSGDDEIWTFTGSDQVYGGPGNDHIVVVVDGTDVVDGENGSDRLSIDASAFNWAGGGSIFWGTSTNAVGQPVAGVDVNSSWQAILAYAEQATTKVLQMSNHNGGGGSVGAALSFSGVEQLDITGSAAVPGADLVFAKGPGVYDGKGGNDVIVADLSAMTQPVRFVTGSAQTYEYLGSSFTNFESFLLSTGDANDYIDAHTAGAVNHLLLGHGDNTALTGAGSDYISTGNGTDWVESGAGHDYVDVRDGQTNYVDAGAGDDTVLGGTGIDVIEARAGNDSVVAGGGDDIIGIVVDGIDSVSAGEGSDRLSIDASAFNWAGGGSIFWGTGTNAAGQPVAGVDVNSSWQAILAYAEQATTKVLQMSNHNGGGGSVGAALSFSGVEQLDITGSAAVPGADLVFAKGPGVYDGKGGNDVIVADLSAMTQPVRFVTGSAQTYEYLGSSFTNFESFLLSTGDANDYIDAHTAGAVNHLLLGHGDNTALTGAGSDYISTGNGTDWVESGAGHDYVDVRDGQTNYVDAGAGDDTVLGGTGIDVIEARAGNDSVVAGGGDDIIGIVVDGIDSVSAGEGSDRLSIDASAFNWAGGGSIFWGTGTNAAGQPVAGVDVNSSWQAILAYAEQATTKVLQMSNHNGGGGSVGAALSFSGVEQLDITGSAAVPGADLIFAKGPGVYDGKGGNDVIVADLSAMTQPVRFVTGSAQTYEYLGSSFTNFESFLLSTGDANDYIDAHTAGAVNHLLLGHGDNTALTGAGSDYISTGNGTDWVESGAGHDYVDVRDGQTNYVDAGAGDDTVLGGTGIDVIEARAGNDSVVAGGGDDIIGIVVDGIDSVSAGEGSDRLSIDASAFNWAGGGSIFWGTGTNAAGQPVAGVDVNSSWQAILAYAEQATTKVLQMSNHNGGGGSVGAALSFSGVEQLDITGSAAVPGADLIFAKGPGVYDGKGGNDVIVADLSAMTQPVRFVTGSAQTYEYLGSSFTNFESFLLSTGDANDYIDAHTAGAVNHLLLGHGDNTALTGAGSDYISTGNGTDWVESGAGHDYVDVRDGQTNYVDAGAGDDTVLGGTGIDVIEARAGNDSVVAGGGDDIIGIVVDGIDSVSAGEGSDRLSIDASAFNWAGGGSIFWGTGTNAAGQPVAGVDVNSSWQAILAYAEQATTKVLQMSNHNGGGGSVGAALSFSGVEQLDITGSAAVPGADLIFAKGPGVYDGKGGNDVIVADLSAMTQPVRFVTGSAQTYEYLGSSFTNFESFLLSTGDANDYIDAHTAGAVNHLLLGHGDNTALTGAGSDYISTGNGTDWVESGAGHDYVDVRDGQTNYVDAGAGDDTVLGGTGIDVIEARAGNDSVVAGGGDDIIGIVVDGIDSVSAGEGSDRLSIDASAFNWAGGGSIFWGTGTNAAGQPVAGVDVNSSWQAILAYAEQATTKVLQMSNHNGGGGSVGAALSFSGVEQLDITGSAAVPGADLIFAKGPGVYDGKGGNDVIVADLSAMTQPVRFVTGSAQTYEYLGSSFTNFESFLLSTGDANDYIDAHTAGAVNHLLLGHGDNTALTGAGSDYISTGNGTDWVESGAGHDYVDVRDGQTNYVDAGAGDDTVLGGTGIDVIEARAGNDSVVAGGGDDIIGIVVDGIDSVSAGEGSDRLSIDASAFNWAGGGSIFWGTGTNAAGQPVAGVDVNSSWQAILAYAEQATTKVLQMSNHNGGGGSVGAALSFSGVEQLDITGSAAVPGADLVFAKGPGVYDGKGGNDVIVADLSAMTQPVRFVTGSAQTYEYLGSSFTNFESFLLSTGDANDYIDSRAASMQDWLSMGGGHDTALTGGGNDHVDGGGGNDLLNGGAGNDTLVGGAGRDVFEFGAAGNGIDTLSDFESGDLLRILGASLDPSSFVASAVGLARNKVNIVSSNGVTTVQVGTDDTPGSDLTILIAGEFQQSAFFASGTDLGLPVANHPPTGFPTADLADGVEDFVETIDARDLLQGFMDPDGDALSVSDLQATHGILVAYANGTWDFLPDANYHGQVVLSYSVVDGLGGVILATQTFSLAAVNDAPIGVPTGDLPVGTEDVPYILMEDLLLEGFTDVDGDELEVAALTVHGAGLEDNQDGTWTVQPQANLDGTIWFEYTVLDGHGGTIAVEQYFELAPVNDAPTLATALPDVVGAVGQALEIQVPEGTFRDVDIGDRLLLSASRSDGSALPVWLSFDALSGTFLGVPQHGDAGVMSLRVYGSDLAGLTVHDDFLLSIASTNSAPQASDDRLSMLRNSSMEVVVRANDSDHDGDALVVVAVTQGTNGTVAINPGTGNPIYTPKRGFTGFDSFWYTVEDGRGGRDNAEVTVLVATQLGSEGPDALDGTFASDVIAGLGGGDRINGGSAADILDGGSGNDTLRGASGADMLRGDAGDDVFEITGGEATGDAFDGGEGYDILALLGSVTLGTAGLSLAGLEGLDLRGFTLTVQGTRALDLSGLAFVSAGVLAGDSAGNSIIGTVGGDSINGAGGNDMLAGRAGDDTIRGGAGADTLVGGQGADTLYSGTGTAGDRAADLFVLDTELSGQGAADAVIGFEASARDRIALDKSVFAAIVTHGTPAVDAGEFRASSGGMPLDADDFLLFDPASGQLYYDPDGVGAMPRVLICTLVGMTGTLDHTDFTTDWPPAA